MTESKKFIPQMEPWFDEHEANALFEYMKGGGWVTEFTKTREFEEEIRKYTGAKYCSIVSNGTVSLTLALMACGIGKGDEVIVPDYTMVATSNAVVLAGAEVVFADVNPESACLDLPSIKKTLTARTKAIILVSINGRYPSDLQDILSFCKENKIRVIEDAAQSLGSLKDGKHVGTFGDVGSFSFAMPKIITTGQGGALITNDETIIKKIRLLRDFGREKGGEDHYLSMGWNFKFTDIQAVVGLEQMKKMSYRVKRKKEIYALYQEELKNVKEINFFPTNLKETTPMFVDVLVPKEKRASLISYLKDKGVGSRLVYPALHGEPVYDLPGSFPGAEEISERGLWLPSASKLTNNEIVMVCTAIKSFFTKK